MVNSMGCIMDNNFDQFPKAFLQRITFGTGDLPRCAPLTGKAAFFL